MMILFLLLRGIYTYPLKKTAIAIGIFSILISLIWVSAVIGVSLNNSADPEEDLRFHPVYYGSETGIILGCFQGILHCILSALLIFGAMKEKEHFLLPWILKMFISILLNVYWLFASLIGDDYQRLYLVYLGFIIIQVQATVSIIRHFQELTEAKSFPSVVDSNPSDLPYGKMTNSVA